MSVPLYADVHVHRAIVEELRLRGLDVLRAQEDNAGEMPDDLLLERATELQRVLRTYDDDLLAIASARQRASERFSGVIFVRERDLRIGWCVSELEVLLQAGLPADFQDRVLLLSHPAEIHPPG